MTFNLTIEESDIMLSLDEMTFDKIENYLSLNKKQTKEYLTHSLESKFNIETVKEKISIARIVHLLFNGNSTFHFVSESINDFSFDSDEDVTKLLIMVARDILDSKIKTGQNSGFKILEELLSSNEYRMSVFRKLAICTIDKNWETTKHLFWNEVAEKDKQDFFSEFAFDKDLRQMLFNNQSKLEEIETQLIQNIIERESQKQKVEDKEYYKLSWYSTLRNIAPFDKHYNYLAKKESLDYKHFDNMNKVTLSSGYLSPLTQEQILEMNNAQLIQYIKNFKPTDDWRNSPNIEGLAEMLKIIIKDNPSIFILNISSFLNIPIIYILQIMRGIDAIGNSLSSDEYDKILIFINQYYNNADKTDKEFPNLIGELSSFIRNIFQKEKVNKQVIESAGQIILMFCKCRECFDVDKFNYGNPVHELYNSSAGKILISTVSYLQYLQKNKSSKDNIDKVLNIFDEKVNASISESYTAIGFSYTLFHYTNPNWLKDKIDNLYKNNDKQLWKSFMGGIIYRLPIKIESIYKDLYPFYEKVIFSAQDISKSIDNQLIRHIMLFYSSGYESLENKNSLIRLFIDKMSNESIISLINYTVGNREYFSKYDNEMMLLWKYLVKNKVEIDEEERKSILATLSQFIVFVPKLDNDNYVLLQESFEAISTERNSYRVSIILDKLESISTNNSNEQAEYIGKLLIALPIFYTKIYHKQIKNIVSYLYKEKQLDYANNLVDRFAREGDKFLQDLYEEYNQLPN